MNDDIKGLMKQYEEDGSDCNRAGLKSMILQFAFADGIDSLDKLTELVDFFEVNAIKKHEKEIQGEKDNDALPFYSESNGIGCIDASKLPPGTNILDVLRGIASKQEIAHSDEEKEETNLFKTIQDPPALVPPAHPMANLSVPESYNLLTTDLKTFNLKMYCMMDDKVLDELNVYREKWKSSSNPYESEWKNDYDMFWTKNDILNWNTFSDILTDNENDANEEWVNPAYANVKPSTIQFGVKNPRCIGTETEASFVIFFDESNGEIISFYFVVD